MSEMTTKRNQIAAIISQEGAIITGAFFKRQELEELGHNSSASVVPIFMEENQTLETIKANFGDAFLVDGNPEKSAIAALARKQGMDVVSAANIGQMVDSWRPAIM